MIECHDLPTAVIKTGVLYKIVGNSFDSGSSISQIVVFDKETTLKDGTFGTTKYIQISSSVLAEIPPHNSKLTIDGVNYKVLNPRQCDSPAFVTFWESEIQRTS